MEASLKPEPPRMFDEYGELRLIPLDEAARLIRLSPEELVELANATAELGIYRVRMVQAVGGPWFDADELEAMGVCYDLEYGTD